MHSDGSNDNYFDRSGSWPRILCDLMPLRGKHSGAGAGDETIQQPPRSGGSGPSFRC